MKHSCKTSTLKATQTTMKINIITPEDKAKKVL